MRPIFNWLLISLVFAMPFGASAMDCRELLKKAISPIVAMQKFSFHEQFNEARYNRAYQEFSKYGFHEGVQWLLEELEERGSKEAPELVMAFIDSQQSHYNFKEDIETLPRVRFYRYGKLRLAKRLRDSRLQWQVSRQKKFKVVFPAIVPKTPEEVMSYAWQTARAFQEIRFMKSWFPSFRWRSTYPGQRFRAIPARLKGLVPKGEMDISLSNKAALPYRILKHYLWDLPRDYADRLLTSQAHTYEALYSLGLFMEERSPEFKAIIRYKWYSKIVEWQRGVLTKIDPRDAVKKTTRTPNRIQMEEVAKDANKFRLSWVKDQRGQVIRSWYFGNLVRAFLISMIISYPIEIMQFDLEGKLLAVQAELAEMAAGEEPLEDVKVDIGTDDSGLSAIERAKVDLERSYQDRLMTRMNDLQNQMCDPSLSDSELEAVYAEREHKQLLFNQSVNEFGWLVSPEVMGQELSCQ